MQAAQNPAIAKKIDWRANIFRVVATLVALLMLMISGIGILAPWGVLPSEEMMNLQTGQEVSSILWYGSVWVAYGTLMNALVLLILVWKPRENPLLMQFWVIGQVAMAIVFTIFVEFSLQTILIPVVLTALYPQPKALFDFKSEGSPSKIFLGVAVLATLVFLPVIWSNFQLFNSAEEFRKMSVGPIQVTYVAFLIPFGAYLMATRRAGWRVLSTIVGLALLYLGLAAISVPDALGSWGLLGGIPSVLAGIVFLAFPRLKPFQTNS